MSLEQPTRKPTGLGTRLIRTAAPFVKACYTHGSVVLVRNETDQVLLVRQGWRERGRWGLPGGFLAVDEEPVAGALRELREETGVTCSPDDLVSLLEYKQPWARHYDHVFGLQVLGDGTISTRSLEIREQGWFAYQDLDDLPPLTSAANEALYRLDAANLLRVNP